MPSEAGSLKVGEKELKSLCLGFEAHKKRREGGTGEQFAGLSIRLVYLCNSEDKYANTNQEMWEGETGLQT